jgi:hypothetical protein
MASCNELLASVVNFHNATGNLVCYENKNIFFYLKNALAYYNAGVGVVNLEDVWLPGLPDRPNLGRIGLAKCRLGSGLGFTLQAWAFCGPGCLFSKIGLGLLLNKQKIQACGLCPKPRPPQARAFGLFSKSPSPRPNQFFVKMNASSLRHFYHGKKWSEKIGLPL